VQRLGQAPVSSVQQAPTEQAALDVFYDGACPACRREIAHYQTLPAHPPLRYVDASADPLPAFSPSRAQLLARLHVRRADGRWLHGAEAFVALWACLPGWRALARVGQWPGVLPVMEATYRLFLRVRPLWRRPRACDGACAPGETR
jgi:predicted DCC family thiol-disulfide oxidoreductase YuxK